MKTKYVIYTVFCLFVLNGFFACNERININTEDSPPRLVIYGYITTDSTQHRIRITRSTGYFSTTKPEGISNAEVRITSPDEEFVLSESPNEPGLYLTKADAAGRIGETYTLHVSVDFDGDGQAEQYESVSYLPPAATIDSVAVQPSSITMFRDLLEIVIWGRIPDAEKNDFSFHLYRNGKLVNDSLQGFFTQNDDYIPGKEIIGLPVFYLDQENAQSHLKPGDFVTVQIEGITHEYAVFIGNARQELYGSDPLFSGPPANIETNIRSLAPTPDILISGFFTAYSKNRASIIYR
jgi:hypothetical protein